MVKWMIKNIEFNKIKHNLPLENLSNAEYSQEKQINPKSVTQNPQALLIKFELTYF